VNPTLQARGSLGEGMPSIDDILEPGRALETLVRRAARGNRPAWRLVQEHTPRIIMAENRWLFPTLLHRQPGGAGRAWLLPLGGEHEQIVELLDQVGPTPAGRLEPMFVAAQSLLLAHLRSERGWLASVLPRSRIQDDTALGRFVAACRPLVAHTHRLRGTAAEPAVGHAGKKSPP
jgi:hypothetical protein